MRLVPSDNMMNYWIIFPENALEVDALGSILRREYRETIRVDGRDYIMDRWRIREADLDDRGYFHFTVQAEPVEGGGPAESRRFRAWFGVQTDGWVYVVLDDEQGQRREFPRRM
jgi:hypothetical protein